MEPLCKTPRIQLYRSSIDKHRVEIENKQTGKRSKKRNKHNGDYQDMDFSRHNQPGKKVEKVATQLRVKCLRTKNRANKPIRSESYHNNNRHGSTYNSSILKVTFGIV